MLEIVEGGLTPPARTGQPPSRTLGKSKHTTPPDTSTLRMMNCLSVATEILRAIAHGNSFQGHSHNDKINAEIRENKDRRMQ